MEVGVVCRIVALNSALLLLCLCICLRAAQPSLGKSSVGSLVTKSRPSEVWESLAHLLGVGVKYPVPEPPPGSTPPLRINAPLVKVRGFGCGRM